MKRFLSVLWVSLCFGMSGCLMTREDVKEVEQKRQMQDQVVYLQKNNADAANRFSEIDHDIRELGGRVEVLEKQSSLTADDKEKQRKTGEDRFEEQNKKIALLEEALAKLEEQIGGLHQEFQTLKETKSAVNKGSEEKESKNPKLYQEAEGFFEAKEWKKAILSYQKFRDGNSKDKKLLAEATYKIGVCFQELKMKSEAKVFYEEAINKYAGTEGAKRSNIRLKQISKSQ